MAQASEEKVQLTDAEKQAAAEAEKQERARADAAKRVTGMESALKDAQAREQEAAGKTAEAEAALSSARAEAGMPFGGSSVVTVNAKGEVVS